MPRTAVLNIVGLAESLLGPDMPRIGAFCGKGALATVAPAFPALTCTAQSTYLTGAPPCVHGIVGNGWYNRELAEVQFWKQSNHLVHGRKLWEELRQRDRTFTCAKLFWWYNMYSTADYSITPRPIYPADGRKIFDIYSSPPSIRPEIVQALGEFPFPTFWGPAAGVRTPQGNPDAASRWIARAAQWIEDKYQPALNLVYLPHLDYNLQRHGPFSNPPGQNIGPRILNPAVIPDLRLVDALAGELIDFFTARSVRVILLSEYALTPVNHVIYLNRLFRKQGWLAIKEELGLELLDCGASKAFAVTDHQVAHIYLNDPALEPQVRELVENQPGIEHVLSKPDKPAWGIDHIRAGDLIAIAAENTWFAYYYWLDDRYAPDFARTVDIHRKPGYDPVELFLDPQLRFPKVKIAWRLLRKKLGFRMLMDLIPLEAGLVKGSHGCRPAAPGDWPVIIVPEPGLISNRQLEATDIYHVIKRCVLG